jgi:mannose-1-phosphate guanylyltransferase
MDFAVILAGGGGTRLWPASRRAWPKQFLALGAREGETLLQATRRRLAGRIPAERTLVVTAAEHVAEAARELPELPAANILGEPCGRNTAAAIGLAAARVAATDDDPAVLGVFPADHHVGDEQRFDDVVAHAYRLAAAREAIVTIGVPPTRPDTGFGYLEPDPEPAPEPDPDPAAASSGKSDSARRVRRFVEKPDRAHAEEYLRRGFLWNAGMFFCRARLVLAELDTHLPATAAAVRAKDPAERAARYPSLAPMSIDFAVMEKTHTPIYTLSGDFGWNDVGAWSALADYRPADPAGNVTAGLVVSHDASRNIAVADPGTLVALLGVSDLIVVRAGNAVLVMPASRAQDVREIVRQLEQRRLTAYL